jgi:hypothetical protein
MEEYKPESELIDFNKLRMSEKFKKKRYVDAIYFGEIERMRRNGIGVMKYKSGRLYEGEWVDDIRDGKGFEKYANGNIYLGLFSHGKAHG